MILHQLELIVLVSMITTWNSCHCFTCHSENFLIRNGFSIGFVRNRRRVKVLHPLHMSSSIMGESTGTDEWMNEVESKLREIVTQKKDSTVTLRNQSLVDRINDLVEQRAEARRQRNYAQADEIRDQIMNLEVIQDNQLLQIMMEDIPYKQGGGSTWSVVWMGDEDKCDPKDAAVINGKNVQQNDNNDNDNKSVIQLAHMALGLAVHASSVVARDEYDIQMIEFFQKELATITNQALVSSSIFSILHPSIIPFQRFLNEN